MASDKIRAERMAKWSALVEAGVDPYGGRVELTGAIARVRAACPETPAEDGAMPTVTVAGRVMAVRDMGKSVWLDLRDRTGKIQANLLQKRVGDAFALAKHLDIGDFLSVTGGLAKSRVGEITVFADAFRFEVCAGNLNRFFPCLVLIGAHNREHLFLAPDIAFPVAVRLYDY